MSFSAIWTRRLKYMLSPQLDLYSGLAERLTLLYDSDNQDVTFSLLDYGCGCGFGALQFKSGIGVDTVIGLDSDVEVVEFAEEIIGSIVPFVHADALDNDGGVLRTRWMELKKNDGPFGVILLIEVIEHLGRYSQSSLIEELADAVEKGRGILVLSTPNKRSQFRKHEGHIGVHDPASLRALLSPHFASVTFEDYLGEPLADDSVVSPLVAICREPK